MAPAEEPGRPAAEQAEVRSHIEPDGVDGGQGDDRPAAIGQPAGKDQVKSEPQHSGVENRKQHQGLFERHPGKGDKGQQAHREAHRQERSQDALLPVTPAARIARSDGRKRHAPRRGAARLRISIVWAALSTV